MADILCTSILRRITGPTYETAIVWKHCASVVSAPLSHTERLNCNCPTPRVERDSTGGLLSVSGEEDSIGSDWEVPPVPGTSVRRCYAVQRGSGFTCVRCAGQHATLSRFLLIGRIGRSVPTDRLSEPTYSYHSALRPRSERTSHSRHSRFISFTNQPNSSRSA